MFKKLSLMLCLFALVTPSLSAEDVEVVSAFCIPTVIISPMEPEGNDQINAAKDTIKDRGGYLYLYLRNAGADPVTIDDIRWNDQGIAERTASYELIWHRLLPNPLTPGMVGEVTLALRQKIAKPIPVEIILSNGQTIHQIVEPDMPAFRLSTITFADNLSTVYLYIQRTTETAPFPATIYRNGVRLDREVTWLNHSYTDNLAVAKITFRDAMQKGGIYVFQVESADGAVNVAASMRAFEDLAVFGTYGGTNLVRYATNGLTAYNSFGRLGYDKLTQGDKLNVRSVMLVHGKPSEDTIAHPGIYAYGQIDEPDVKDYGVKDRPMKDRIGAYAPQMVEYEQSCRDIDPLIPTTLTIDLTFTPYNYFVYAPIPDIANPDCYAISNGWSVERTKGYVAQIKHAAQPRPFTFTYQGCWEEWGIPQGRWISGSTLVKEGFEKYRDPCRVRGLGRAPAPAEVRIPMLYAIGYGARGLFSYVDSSEGGGSLLFHGSDILPELWSEIGRTSRQLNTVAPMIDIAHPMNQWAVTDNKNIWLRTLIAGDQAALVVAVNDDYQCLPQDFICNPQSNVTFTLPDLPWLAGQQVYRVGDQQFHPLDAARKDQTLQWHDDIQHGQLYLITRDPAVMHQLQQRITDIANQQARTIIEQERRDTRAQGQRRLLQRQLANSPQAQLLAHAVNGYAVTDNSYWNPNDDSRNAIEFYQKSGDKAMGAKWPVTVTAPQVGQSAVFYWQGRTYGNIPRLTLLDGQGNIIDQQRLKLTPGNAIQQNTVRFPRAGDYVIQITAQPDQPREHGGRLAQVAYLLFQD